MIGARMYVEQPVGADVLVRGGADLMLDHYDLLAADSREQRRSQELLYPPRNDLVLGMHVDAVVQVTDRWEVTPGVRFDLFESVKKLESLSRSARLRSSNGAVPSVDPRLLSRLRLAKAVTLVSTFGVSHQPPAFFVPIPGLQLGRLDDGLQTSIQTSQGLEVSLPLAFTLTPTVFYHRYLGLTDFATTCGISDNSPTQNDSGGDCLDERVGGRTYGFELLLRRSLTQKLTGWVSYTLSRTTRQTRTAAYTLEALQTDTARTKVVTDQEIPGDFDRTHVLNVIGACDLGLGWRAGARFYYYTGRPYSRQAFGYTVPPFNEQRYPDFYRIDARVEKAWKVGQKGRISVVLEWLNVTLRKEATSVKCGEGATTVRDAIAAANHCEFDTIGPVTIPSLGVEGAF